MSAITYPNEERLNRMNGLFCQNYGLQLIALARIEMFKRIGYPVSTKKTKPESHAAYLLRTERVRIEYIAEIRKEKSMNIVHNYLGRLTDISLRN